MTRNRIDSLRLLLGVYALLFLSLVLLYGKQLLSFTLSGDDLYALELVPKNIGEIITNFTNVSGQYRPITYLLLSIIKIFLPHVTFIFFEKLALFTLVPTLLYFIIKQISTSKISLFLTISTLFSPIFYYHFFTVSSFGNILILIIELLLFSMVLSSPHKKSIVKVCAALLLYFLSFFIKESFFVCGFLCTLILFQNLKRKDALCFTAIIIIISTAYLFFRLILYHSADPNYMYVFSLLKLKENVILITAWIFNYPKGWQYGAPNPKTMFTFGVSIITLLAYIISSINIFKLDKKVFFIYCSLLFLSIAPFLFLNRILVFYFDTTLLILIFAFGYSLQSLFCEHEIGSKYQKLFIILVIYVSNYFVILPQWLHYSFVANANEAARNYISAVRTNITSRDSRICIINHTKGVWATENGNVINFVQKKHIDVVSAANSSIPLLCQNNSLILSNDDRRYSVVRLHENN